MLKKITNRINLIYGWCLFIIYLIITPSKKLQKTFQQSDEELW